MEIIYIIDLVLMSIAVSLGVGCSTVAVAQFFIAITDGKIDGAERKMMGMVYFLLRIAMGVVLLTVLVQFGIIYYLNQTFGFISPLFLAIWTLTAVLFINAIGMTRHWIPSSIGPALQASSWYAFGILLALISVGVVMFTFTQFILVYLGVICLATAIINFFMAQINK